MTSGGGDFRPQQPLAGRQVVVPVGASALVFAAAFGTFVAVISYHLLCDTNSESCLEGNPNAELVWQLVLGVAGLPVAAAMAWAAMRGRIRVAGALLAVGLVLYAGWAVLLDLATHGGRFTLLPELILLVTVAIGAVAIRRFCRLRGTRDS